MSNKNHEGYHDPTAYNAIQNVSIGKQRRKRRWKRKQCLKYCIGEVLELKELME